MIRELFAEEIEARAQPFWRQADFLNDVRHMIVQSSDDGLVRAIDHDAVICLGDFVDIFDRISSLKRYQLSQFDRQDFVAPLWDSLLGAVRQGHVRCWCDPHLEVLKHGRIATNDLLVFLERYGLPDDGRSVTRYHTDAVETYPDDCIGSLMQCRTASAVVEFHRAANFKRLVDMQMPLLLAAGYAPPVTQDKDEQRYAGPPRPTGEMKCYRGNRYD